MKEANLLERQEAGMLIEDPQQVYRGSEWETVREQLDRVSIPLTSLGDVSTSPRRAHRLLGQPEVLRSPRRLMLEPWEEAWERQ